MQRAVGHACAVSDISQWRAPLPSNYVPELDGLRAVAIALVVAVHLELVEGGFVGVNLFFVLSGYLITSLLLDERRRTARIALRSFYVRRLGRLYPALIVAVLLGSAAGAALMFGPKTIVLEAFLTLSYTSNLYTTVRGVLMTVLNPTWTLAQEEQFYLIAPFLLRRIRIERYARIAGVLLVVATALSVTRLVLTLTVPTPWERTYENPLLNADGMLIGVALALIVASGRIPRWLLLTARSRIALCAALLTIALAVTFADLQTWRLAAGLTGTAFAAAVILGHLATTEGRTVRLLRSAPLLWLGRRSYGLYLYHLPLILLCRAYVPEGALRLAAMLGAVGVAVLLSGVSLRWIETPARRWVRQRFKDAAEGPTRSVPTPRG